MKKKLILIFIILFKMSFSYSQDRPCASDEYLKAYKDENKDLDAQIREVIAGFANGSEKDVDSEGNKSAFPENVLWIPVVFNIVHHGESVGSERNMSLDKINEQLTILNAAYRGQYGGVDTRIQFCLAKQNIFGQATTGVNRFQGSYDSYDIGFDSSGNCSGFNFLVDSTIKSNVSPGFPSSLFLNIWITDIKDCGQDNLLGYSSFPFSGGSVALDGVVVDYKYLGTNTNTSSTGNTLVHEIGHWLGLFHVFQDEDNVVCNYSDGDFVDDTDQVPNSGLINISSGDCLGYKCDNGHPTVQMTSVVQNFMDYQNTNRFYCQKSFTAGQKTRMKDMLSHYRTSIYMQGTNYNISTCAPPSTGGSGGYGGCGPNLPAQLITKPNLDKLLDNRQFGVNFEVNDKWLVTFDQGYKYYNNNPLSYNTSDVLAAVRIYKRIGCLFTLHQSFDLPDYHMINLDLSSNVGIIMNNDEIIISSYVTDSVYIYHYNASTDSWFLFQQIQIPSASSSVATKVFTANKFLFVLELNAAGNNQFRIFYKNSSGNYVLHQTLSPGFNLPYLDKFMKAGNFVESNVNINSSSFVGTYDPQEILLTKGRDVGGTNNFILLGLNSSNMWVVSNVIQPVGLSNNESVHDIEVTKNHIYVVTSIQLGPGGSMDDIVYLYTYKINPNNINPFSATYNKQELINRENGIYHDVDLKVINDQFLFIDNTKYYPLQMFYNQNFANSSLVPYWQRKTNIINCNNPGMYKDTFKIFGNLLFYGYYDNVLIGGEIHIYNIANILSSVGYSSTFINNSDFFNKTICSVPADNTTFAKTMTVGGSCSVVFNNVSKEFIANESISIKPGVTILQGSQVGFKIADSNNTCNGIVAKSGNDESDTIGYNEVENHDFKNLNENILVFPNPNNGIFNISLKEIKDGTILITDVIGHTVYNAKFKNQKMIEVNMQDKPLGVYFVKVISGNQICQSKIIKN